MIFPTREKGTQVPVTDGGDDETPAVGNTATAAVEEGLSDKLIHSLKEKLSEAQTHIADVQEQYKDKLANVNSALKEKLEQAQQQISEAQTHFNEHLQGGAQKIEEQLTQAQDQINRLQDKINANLEQGEQSLQEKLDQAQARIEELQDQYKRSLADAENTRRRAQQEIKDARQYAVERWAHELIEVKDNLERALQVPDTASIESLRQGVELTLKQLQSAFEKVNLKDIDPKGEVFDPKEHQALTMVDAPMPAKTVVDVMRKGYKLGDRVIRPAEVVISKGEDTSKSS